MSSYFGPLQNLNISRQIEETIRKQLEDYIARERIAFKIAEMMKELMLARTRSWQDAEGQLFAPYSPEYEEVKRNPYVGGSLLNEIKVIESLTGEAILGISDKPHDSGYTANELANIHVKGLGNMPRREFFGWRQDSPEDWLLKKYIEMLIINLKG
jgi:hypothetical protein